MIEIGSAMGPVGEQTTSPAILAVATVFVAAATEAAISPGNDN